MPTTYYAYEIKLQFQRDDLLGERCWIDASNPLGGLASLTPDCMSVVELEQTVADIKRKLDDAVKSAKRKFRKTTG